jgi:hypothetical protein
MRNFPLPRFALSIATAALVTIALAAPASAAPSTVSSQYHTYAYIAATRQGSAVYINGLVKQDYSTGLIRSHGRTIYLQRNLNGSWQTMLSRVTDWQGKFTVGFISVVSYQYRYLVTESGSALATTSGTATPPVYVTTFANCTDANHYYPHGIGVSGAHDHTSGTPVTTFYVSSALYKANTALDRDKDLIACEKR